MQTASVSPHSLRTPAEGPCLRLIEGGLPFRVQLAAMAPLLLPRALHLTRDRDRARDLVQDTCVRALRFEHTFTPGTHFKAWLQQVMYSVFIGQCRRNKQERLMASTCALDPSAVHGEMAPSPHPGLLPGLKRALAELPQGFGHTLVLVDLQDHSYQEAASALGVPVGTVMSRLHRARRLLGEQLFAEAA